MTVATRRATGRKSASVRDRDVRRALHSKVLRDHHGDADTLVLDELGLRHGASRVDIAVVNGFLHGFEIKSEADTLERLRGQVAVYNAVLDRVTLVVGEKHLAKAEAQIPSWWGIKIVAPGPRGGIDFDHARAPKMNPAIDPMALAELLWRPEVIEILADRELPPRTLRQPRTGLYRCLVELVSLDDLREIVRQRLKARERWRGHRPPLTGAGSSTPTPMS
jgi:hypothetical protein